MPCGACGSSVSETSPPSSSIRATVRSKTSWTPDSMPSASPASSLGTPKLQALQVLAARQLDPALDPDRGRVARVAALDGLEQERRVGDVPGQRAALVERGGEGDHPVAGDRAVGGLHADDPAERGRLADRAAGVGADRAGREAARDGRRGAAGGAAGDAARVPGVEHRAVARVLVRGAHRELVHVRLAEHPRARLAQPADRRRRIGRAVALQDPRARGGRDSLGAEDVLDGDGNPAQRAIARFLGFLGRPEVGVERVPGGGLAVGVEVLVGREVAGADPLGRLGDREIDQLRAHLRLWRGDAEGAGGRVGRALEHLVAVPAGPRLVGPEDVLELDHVRGRLDAVQVELGRCARRARGCPRAPRPSARPRARSAAAARAWRRAALVPARSWADHRRAPRAGGAEFHLRHARFHACR